MRSNWVPYLNISPYVWRYGYWWIRKKDGKWQYKRGTEYYSSSGEWVTVDIPQLIAVQRAVETMERML